MTEKKLNTLIKKFDDFKFLLESALHKECLKNWNSKETLKLSWKKNKNFNFRKIKKFKKII